MDNEVISEIMNRLAQLEDKVDNQLIGGLRKAKDKYDDDLAYEDFKGKYSDQISKIDEGMKRASGNKEYDTCREFYDAIKTVDGYKDGSIDVATMIADKIKELAYRYNIPLEVEVSATTEEEKEAPEKETPEEKEESEEDRINRIATSIGL